MAKKQKQSVRSRIARYLYTHQKATKAELARALSVSMPTLLSSITAMIEDEILVYGEELESTGGRKATTVGLNPEYASSAGISITRSAVQFVLLDFTGQVLSSRKIPYSFTGSNADLAWLSQELERFLQENPGRPPLIGCGIALPGIIDQNSKSLNRSHVLDLENYSLTGFENSLSADLLFENDANAALLAERPKSEDSLIFLYLGRTVGGTLFNAGKIAYGDHSRAGEFGHMILYPNGKTCYCGKHGCADAYCSVSALTSQNNSQLEQFMEKAVQNPDSEEGRQWNALLDSLALLCSNLRMAFDMDILIGGPLGQYVRMDLEKLREKIRPLDLFERNPGYIRIAGHDHSSAAIGAAELFFMQEIENLK